MDYFNKYLKYNSKLNGGALYLPINPDNNPIHNFDIKLLSSKDKQLSEQFSNTINSYKKFFINAHGEIGLNKFIILPKNTYLLSFSATGTEAFHPIICNKYNELCNLTMNNNNNVNIQISRMIFKYRDNYNNPSTDYYDINNGYKLYEPGDIIPLIDFDFYEHEEDRREIRGVYELPLKESNIFALNNNYSLSRYEFTKLPAEIIIFFILHLNDHNIYKSIILIIDKLENLKYNKLTKDKSWFIHRSELFINPKYINIINKLKPHIKSILKNYLSNINNIDNQYQSMNFNERKFKSNITQKIIDDNSKLIDNIINHIESKPINYLYNFLSEFDSPEEIQFLNIIIIALDNEYIYCSQLQTMVLNIVNKLLNYKPDDILSPETQFSLENNLLNILQNINYKKNDSNVLIITSACLSDISHIALGLDHPIGVDEHNHRGILARSISNASINKTDIKYNKKSFIELLNSLESIKVDKDIKEYLNNFIHGINPLEISKLKEYATRAEYTTDIKKIIDFIEGTRFKIEDL